MGLLDDAIREHLDLKRRRGADPTEIERAEREALGPVRRGPDVTGRDVASPDDGEEAEGPLYAPAESEHWEPFDEDPELLEEDDEPPPYEHPRAPDGDPLMDDDRRFEDEHRVDDERHGADPRHSAEAASALPPHPTDPPSPRPAPHPDELPPHLDQETEEYDVESEREGDVLESTPEFLQDAPEHDRLWFEQRPPRDFDFDG